MILMTVIPVAVATAVIPLAGPRVAKVLVVSMEPMALKVARLVAVAKD